jgi:hypothetical protein
MIVSLRNLYGKLGREAVGHSDQVFHFLVTKYRANLGAHAIGKLYDLVAASKLLEFHDFLRHIFLV